VGFIRGILGDILGPFRSARKYHDEGRPAAANPFHRHRNPLYPSAPGRRRGLDFGIPKTGAACGFTAERIVRCKLGQK
jgi:hypothetical protein